MENNSLLQGDFQTGEVTKQDIIVGFSLSLTHRHIHYILDNIQRLREETYEDVLKSSHPNTEVLK